MQKIVLALACLAFASCGRRVEIPKERQLNSVQSLSQLLLGSSAALAFSPSASGARLPTTRPNVAISLLRHTPVRGISASLSAADVEDDAVQERHKGGTGAIVQRLLSSALLKRSAAIAARATGTLAAALLFMQATAFAMEAGSSLPLAAMFSPAKTWAAYEQALATHPLLVKALTSLTGFTLGDILAQKLVEKVPEYDIMRTVRLGSFGLLWHGPSSHYFYGFLDNLIPGTDMTTVATKVFADQVLWNPIFGTIFFTYLNFAEGKTIADLKKKIQQDLLTAVKGSWGFWVPAHFVNFRFIPGDQRVLYINSLQILYNIFLSIIGNRQVQEK